MQAAKPTSHVAGLGGRVDQQLSWQEPDGAHLRGAPASQCSQDRLLLQLSEEQGSPRMRKTRPTKQSPWLLRGTALLHHAEGGMGSG